MRKLWKNYSLSIVLATCFVLSLVGQYWVGWQHYQSEQAEHHQPSEVLGKDGYIWAFGDAVLENWQSEFLQLLAFVILTTYFIHRGSHESKDSDEEVQARLENIEARLGQLVALQEGRTGLPNRSSGEGEQAPTPGSLPRGTQLHPS